MTALLQSIPEPATITRFESVDIVGVRFDVCDYASVIQWLSEWLDVDDCHARFVCVSNVADVMSARNDELCRAALSASDLTVPDGTPIVWAMRDFGRPIKERVYGPTLMQMVLEDESLQGARHLLIGGTHAARDGIQKRFADANWVGELDLQFDQLDDAAYLEIARQYDRLEPDFVWVCLGGDRQTKFMHRLVPLVSGGTMLGVGAAIDFHAGLLMQAPRWMQRNGLEWLFRLAMEPRRLWHRYLIHNPPYLWHWFRQRRQVARNRRRQ